MPHPAPDLEGPSPAPARGDGRVRVARYAAALGLVGAATSIGALARGHLSEPDLVLLYLLAVVIAAARFGRGPSLVAATLSVLAFDFFFIPPFFTFLVHEKRYVLTFAIMLVVSLVTSGLSLRVTTEERRSSLLSALSHDLRTPLAAITGAATTLRDESAAIDDAQRREMLDTICEEADRLERLVRNLLDMTRLESGALAVKRQWLPLEEIVGSALTRLEPQLEGRPIRTDLPADLPLVSVDAVLLEQLFVNLLENAAKYTPAGSPVEIVARAGAESRVVAIEVADRGPGIQPGDESRLFEKFVRGRQQTGSSGAGLGLAICRGVIGAHGGTIVAANRPGGGAAFRITLPIVGTPPPPAPSETSIESEP
jgi:K+-sensing histidine kinase KdpD